MCVYLFEWPLLSFFFFGLVFVDPLLWASRLFFTPTVVLHPVEISCLL